eukprot:Gb_22425 [translate_table: standard]
MRAVVITEELVEAAWKFTGKSARMGPVAGSISEKASRLSFNQKVQLTISVCFGIILCTLLLFVLCALDDPGIVRSSESAWALNPPLKSRIDDPIPRTWRILQSWNSPLSDLVGQRIENRKPRVAALHGMGVLFRKGTRAANELIVAHLVEGAPGFELRTFLRTLLRSGAMARADLVLLFPRGSLTEDVHNVIQEESDFGYKKFSSCFGSNIVGVGGDGNRSLDRCSSVNSSVSVFNSLAFKSAAEETKRRRKNVTVNEGDFSSVPRPPGEGSIMGFEMDELDPDNVLEAFIDDPPAQLRRWLCYQMLLGLLKHKFRNVMLIRIGAAVILSDALSVIRKKSNALLLLMEARSWDIEAGDQDLIHEEIQSIPSIKDSEGVINSIEADAGQPDRLTPSNPIKQSRHRHKKKRITAQKKTVLARTMTTNASPRRNKTLLEAVYGVEVSNSLEGEEKNKRLISSGVITGTMAPVRLLANAMVNEIIRITLERKSKKAFPDQIPLSYLVHKSSILGHRVTDNLQLIDNRRSTFIYTMTGTNQTVNDLFGNATGINKHGVIDGLSEEGRSASLAEIIRQDLCKSSNDASVYPDCIQSAHQLTSDLSILRR